MINLMVNILILIGIAVAIFKLQIIKQEVDQFHLKVDAINHELEKQKEGIKCTEQNT